MLTRIPVDSADAREIREAEHEAKAALEHLDQVHAVLCQRGWLGYDPQGRPIPCPRCRPHLYARPCSTCSKRDSLCSVTRRRTGRGCCDHCTHAEGPSLEEAIAKSEATT